ncbi:hypothetical protein AYR47_20775 [Pseudomonas azotoformans]|uniref:Uncharacterized protein n=2 Tax=Pseudomonas azotoformans TaxID=47878 RepID=A0A127I1W4_PSEAZ|nr:hypothetical protein AYR47_20775 [Pseudomonas azotoformans]
MIARELQLLLAIVLVLSAVALLKPERITLAEPTTRQRSTTQKNESVQDGMQWVRQPVVLVEATLPADLPSTDVTLIAPPELIELASSEPAPMMAPTPNVIYLGRLKQAQEDYVFLDAGEGARAYKQGDTLTGNWQVTRITGQTVKLRDRHLGTVREVKMFRENTQQMGTDNRTQSLSRGLPIQ